MTLLATLGAQLLAMAAEHAEDDAHGSAEESHATPDSHNGDLHNAAHDTGHHGLHFSPPLLGKNPTPVTELRLDYFFTDRIHHEGEKHTIRVVGEYAFARWISVEVGVPYTIVNEEGHDSENDWDTVDIGLKLASFAFEDYGIVF